MSGIRVIAGSARGRRLNLVPGDSTRPITDRVKENLFNIFGPGIVRSSFLDAFAGTGSVGIEALSRGAEYARFFDLNRRAVQTIRENLELTRFSDRAQVLQRDVLVTLAGLPDRRFDYIFVAPPQYHELWSTCLNILDGHAEWLAEKGEIVVQVDPREWRELDLLSLVVFDQRRYGNTLLVFYERSDPGQS